MHKIKLRRVKDQKSIKTACSDTIYYGKLRESGGYFLVFIDKNNDVKYTANFYLSIAIKLAITFFMGVKSGQYTII